MLFVPDLHFLAKPALLWQTCTFVSLLHLSGCAPC